jgi:hypothetical protein
LSALKWLGMRAKAVRVKYGDLMSSIREAAGKLLVMDGQTAGGNVIQLIAGGCETNINEGFP